LKGFFTRPYFGSGILILLLVSLLLVACGDPTSTPLAPTAAPVTPVSTTAAAPAASGVPAVSGNPVKTASGLQYIDVKVGTGAEAVAGKTVTVHYTGYLTNGTKFDSSVDKNQPFSFPLGAGRVIRGWDEGVAGMKIGGQRRLIIPPQLGYGSQPVGPIPPNSQLIFDVQLLAVS
jgi:FKBP-type peptidyl-prolyl cis-trans isomerase FkpA